MTLGLTNTGPLKPSRRFGLLTTRPFFRLANNSPFSVRAFSVAGVAGHPVDLAAFGDLGHAPVLAILAAATSAAADFPGTCHGELVLASPKLQFGPHAGSAAGSTVHIFINEVGAGLCYNSLLVVAYVCPRAFTCCREEIYSFEGILAVVLPRLKACFGRRLER